MINGVAIDYVHGVMLGVVELLLKLWFSTEFKMEKYNCCEKFPLFDQYLLKIKPPIEITRPPRSYEKFGHDWKASGYHSFYCFIASPLCWTFYCRTSFQIFLLCVTVYTYSFQYSISKLSLDYGEKMLIRFFQDFQLIYGQRYMLSNIHQLIHLCDDVKHLGFHYGVIHVSVWRQKSIYFAAHSWLAKNWISIKLCCQWAIPEVTEKNISTDPLLMRFYESMNKQKVLPFNQSLGNGIAFLAKVTKSTWLIICLVR